MRLIRWGERGRERPGLELKDGTRLDCGGAVRDYDRTFFAEQGLAQLEALARQRLPPVPAGARLGAPVARPGKLVCIGLNYRDHAAESGAPVPTEPIVFLKGTNTVIGPMDEVLIPRTSVKTDWEVELGVIIGSEARYLPDEQAAEACIAGYAISNDVSERAFQLERGGQWTKGKSCDTFNPLGPWLVTRDEVPDPQDLALHLDVNGVREQTGSTRSMIFGVRTLVHYLSQFMTLEPGDVITTGTPPGVGLGKKPPRYLKPGDVMELAITGLGVQRQRVGQA